MLVRFYALCSFCLVLAGCSSQTEVAVSYTNQPAGAIYNAGLEALETGAYDGAAKAFLEVGKQHPYSSLAPKSLLMAAFADYRGEKSTDAVTTLQSFITLHPGNPLVGYAYYLKALVYYHQIIDAGRDQLAARQALAAFQEVINRFPLSRYAQDAHFKLEYTRNHLAGQNMNVGRFYQKRQNFLAAIQRYGDVIATYERTQQTPEALYRLTEVYASLGISPEAQRMAALLGHNFPQSPWYRDAYALLNRAMLHKS